LIFHYPERFINAFLSINREIFFREFDELKNPGGVGVGVGAGVGIGPSR
jgi:hypothetical protein